MLAAIIVLSVVVAALIVFVQTAWSKIDRMEKKLNDLLNYDPYTGDSVSEYKRLCSRKPYDTKPEFIKGIDAMVEELERSLRNRLNYGRRYDGVSQDRLDRLEERVDEVDRDINASDLSFGKDITALKNQVEGFKNEFYGMEIKIENLHNEVELVKKDMTESMGGIDGQLVNTGILNSHFEDSEDEDAGE